MSNFCGPYALAFVNSISLEAAADIFRTHRREPRSVPVKGVSVGAMAVCLKATCGFRRVQEWRRPRRSWEDVHSSDIRGGMFGKAIEPDPRPTVASFLVLRENRAATYILSLTDHFIVVKGNYIYDTMNRTGVLSSKYQRRRARVEVAWEIGR